MDIELSSLEARSVKEETLFGYSLISGAFTLTSSFLISSFLTGKINPSWIEVLNYSFNCSIFFISLLMSNYLNSLISSAV
jgi:hypothetical protein